jgi:hypothetical protein
MWILFGNRTRVRPVRDGRAIERHCSECKQVRRFVECDVADKVSVFFVPVFDMTSRRMVCPECGDDCDVPSDAEARPANSAGPTRPASSASPPPRPSESDLEKMLADLKEKLGK